MVSTSNKRSLRIRTGPHDYGPREWGFFFSIGLSLLSDVPCSGHAESHVYLPHTFR